jgi:hypothetical protein
MKRQVFTLLIICLALPGIGQFVQQPLNYPGPGYWPFYISIVDPDHVWIGSFHESGIPYSFSAKTTNGGNTWISDSIPVPGQPVCVSICGWDTNVCFHVHHDQSGLNDPSIWKTTDGGTSWTNIISAQFTGSFINFYHAFSADTGLAVGDPRDGYFEIQRTSDQGLTWIRVPSANIPAILPNEIGLNHSYSAVGNSIWFTTSKARCYRSTDKGQTWAVTEIIPGASLDLGVCFSTEQKGALWNRGANTNPLVITNDGGIHWDTVPFPPGYRIQDISRVPGIEGGFVVTAYISGIRVYYTLDHFSTLLVLHPGIMSNGAVEFFNASTGWLGGGESGSNQIFKFTGMLDAGGESRDQATMSLFPNPTSGDIFLSLPQGLESNDLDIRVTDMTGRVMKHDSPPESADCQLDLSHFANGIYMVALYSENKILAIGRCVVNH